jgi:hypothetical protein
LKLSPLQVAAAKSRGFALFPATQAQIERMTMQRRIFDVEGRPHVVSRDGVYFETHATLAPVIATAPAQPVATAPVPMPVAAEAAPEPVAPTLAQTVATAPEPGPAAEEAPPGEEPAEETAPPVPRRRLSRPRSEEGTEGAAPRPSRRRAMAARAEEPALTAPEDEARPEDDTDAASRRRARPGEPPRWRVAGAMRRGRLPRG